MGIRCKLCHNKRHFKAKDYESHLIEIHRGMYVRCPECRADPFETLDMLKFHMAAKHEESEGFQDIKLARVSECFVLAAFPKAWPPSQELVREGDSALAARLCIRLRALGLEPAVPRTVPRTMVDTFTGSKYNIEESLLENTLDISLSAPSEPAVTTPPTSSPVKSNHPPPCTDASPILPPPPKKVMTITDYQNRPTKPAPRILAASIPVVKIDKDMYSGYEGCVADGLFPAVAPLPRSWDVVIPRGIPLTSMKEGERLWPPIGWRGMSSEARRVALIDLARVLEAGWQPVSEVLHESELVCKYSSLMLPGTYMPQLDSTDQPLLMRTFNRWYQREMERVARVKGDHMLLPSYFMLPVDIQSSYQLPAALRAAWQDVPVAPCSWNCIKSPVNLNCM